MSVENINSIMGMPFLDRDGNSIMAVPAVRSEWGGIVYRFYDGNPIMVGKKITSKPLLVRGHVVTSPLTTMRGGEKCGWPFSQSNQMFGFIPVPEAAEE